MSLGNGSNVSWTICKQCAPHSRQITTPTPHSSIFTGWMFFLTPTSSVKALGGVDCSTAILRHGAAQPAWRVPHPFCQQSADGYWNTSIFVPVSIVLFTIPCPLHIVLWQYSKKRRWTAGRNVSVKILSTDTNCRKQTHTHTHTHTPVQRPFFRDYPGEPVPER